MSLIGFGLGVWRSGRGYDPGQLFVGGANGIWIDPSDLSSMYQDSGGTVAAAVDAPVGRIDDKSGRGHHATQGLASARPMLRRDEGGRLYLAFDGFDDFLHHGFTVTDGDVTLSCAVERSGTGVVEQGLFTVSPPATPLQAAMWAVAVPPEWGTYAGDEFRSSGFDAASRSVLTAVGLADPDTHRLLTNGGGAVEFAGSYGGDGHDRRVIGREHSAQASRHFSGRLYSLVGIGRGLGAGELAQLVAHQKAKAGIG